MRLTVFSLGCRLRRWYRLHRCRRRAAAICGEVCRLLGQPPPPSAPQRALRRLARAAAAEAPLLWLPALLALAWAAVVQTLRGPFSG